MNQQLVSKREHFTETIRKRNKKQSLDEQRKRSVQMLKIIATMPQKTQEQLLQQREKLRCLSVVFRGEPDDNWKQYIDEMRNIMETCQDYSHVVEICIVKQICLVFKKQFRNLNLTKNASLLFNYMVFHNKVGTCPLVRMLSEYGLIDDLLILIVEEQWLENKVEELHLIGNMIGQNGYIRNVFFEKGWIQILIALEKNKKLGQDMRNLIVWLINCTMIFYENTQYNLKNNVGSVFIEILVDYLLDEKSGEQRKIDAINGLASIIKNKDTAAHTIAKQKDLYHHLILIVQSKQEALKPSVWKLLNLFIQPKIPQIAKEMINAGVLNTITNTLKKNINTSYRVTIEKLIIKLSENSQQNLDLIVKHPLFDIIIQRSSLYFSSSSQEIIFNNLILISYLTSPLPYFTLRNILEETPILQNLNEHIMNTQTSPQILRACLSIIQHLIHSFNNIYSPNGVNYLIQKLQRQYSLSTKIYDISNNHKNEAVIQAAEKIYDEFVKTYD